MPAKPILLVEDNLDDVLLILRVLTRAEIAREDDVVVARDGVEALDYVLPADVDAPDAERLPRVIFLDLKMPRLDGLEVLRRLRADTRTRLIPVVILTSSDEEADLTQSYRLGANSYIRKPEDFGQFADAVRQAGQYWTRLNLAAAGRAGA
jgi:two-component system response regulator